MRALAIIAAALALSSAAQAEEGFCEIKGAKPGYNTCEKSQITHADVFTLSDGAQYFVYKRLKETWIAVAEKGAEQAVERGAYVRQGRCWVSKQRRDAFCWDDMKHAFPEGGE